MSVYDMILDGSHTPDLKDIPGIMDDIGKSLWQDMASFMRQDLKCSPALFYSKCSGKPGWNVKFKRSGKSYVTLYPEPFGFTALVVMPDGLIPVVEAMAEDLEENILKQIHETKPLNGTVWLMISVGSDKALEGVKKLLRLKYVPSQAVKP